MEQEATVFCSDVVTLDEVNLLEDPYARDLIADVATRVAPNTMYKGGFVRGVLDWSFCEYDDSPGTDQLEPAEGPVQFAMQMLISYVGAVINRIFTSGGGSLSGQRRQTLFNRSFFRIGSHPGLQGSGLHLDPFLAQVVISLPLDLEGAIPIVVGVRDQIGLGTSQSSVKSGGGLIKEALKVVPGAQFVNETNYKIWPGLASVDPAKIVRPAPGVPMVGVNRLEVVKGELRRLLGFAHLRDESGFQGPNYNRLLIGFDADIEHLEEVIGSSRAVDEVDPLYKIYRELASRGLFQGQWPLRLCA